MSITSAVAASGFGSFLAMGQARERKIQLIAHGTMSAATVALGVLGAVGALTFPQVSMGIVIALGAGTVATGLGLCLDPTLSQNKEEIRPLRE